MQKADLTLPQALKRLKKARRLGPRGDRRRHRAARCAPVGLEQELGMRRSLATESASALPAASRRPASQHQLRASRCSCRNDAGSSRRDRPVDHPLDARRLRSPGHQQHDRRASRIVPIPIDSASAGTSAGSPPKSAALLRRVSGSSVTRCVRAASSRRRLVEPDVPVGADAEDQQVDAAGGLDRLLVAAHSASGIGRGAVEEV